MTRNELVRDALGGSNESLWHVIRERIGDYPEGGIDFAMAMTVVEALPREELALYVPTGETLDS